MKRRAFLRACCLLPVAALASDYLPGGHIDSVLTGKPPEIWIGDWKVIGRTVTNDGVKCLAGTMEIRIKFNDEQEARKFAEAWKIAQERVDSIMRQIEG